MKIRLGYVAISNKLGKKVTSSSSVTFKTYSSIATKENKIKKLKEVAISNVNDLEKIIKYNIENNIHFYRLTSKLIPLITHPEVEYYGHRKFLEKDLIHIGKLIKESNMRVDTHPDQFNVINSVNNNVVESTIVNLKVHNELFEDLHYPYGKMVIHVGGATNGKEVSLQRFIDNYKKIPEELGSKLIIENDDKTFNIKEVLYLCNELSLPMVLDVHHHNCNNDGDLLENYLEKIFNTWNNEYLHPKIHFSSPREFINDRKHADFIDVHDFYKFLKIAKVIDRDFDCMLECKEKDLALFKLVDDLKEYYPEVNWIDNSTLVL